MLYFLNARTLNTKNKKYVWSVAENLCTVLFVGILLNVTNHRPVRAVAQASVSESHTSASVQLCSFFDWM